MNVGTRHPSVRRRGLSAFASMSLIALLALVCLPVSVQADSSGVQYSDDLPGLPPEKDPSKGKQPPAKSSVTNGGATAKQGADGEAKGVTDGSSEEDSSSKEGGVAAGADDRGNGQGSPGGSANTKDNALVQPNGQASKGTSAAQSDDGSGSSPLLPILIAILVLAAISVAVVMVKQRRQGDGSAGTAPSPKAS